MPVCDGLTATRRIRGLENARPPDDLTPATHIIALTAHSDASEECFGSGMDDYITKPVSVEARKGGQGGRTGLRVLARGHRGG